MTEFVTFLSTGENTWTPVLQIMKSEKWSKVIIIGNEPFTNIFSEQRNVITIILKKDNSLKELTKYLENEFKTNLISTQVAFNMLSGTGREHMAALGALLKCGVGIRLVYYDNKVLEL